jgi:hypothetical protein
MLETESVQSETARNFSRLFNESGYTKIRELIDRLFIEANGNKSAFEEALREADIEFVSSESDIVAVPAKYEEENTVYNYFEDGGGVWCYVPPVKNTLQ